MTLAFVLFFSQFSQARIQKEQIRFRYAPFESKSIECQHERIRDLPDWNVFCKGPHQSLDFKVHLVLRKHPRQAKFTAFELLYWVTRVDRENNKNHYSGTSLMLTLDRLANEKEIRIGQAMNNHTAELEMVFYPQASRK